MSGWKKTLLTLLCATTFVSGCKKEQPNPVLENKYNILTWLYDNKTTEIETCAQYWADPIITPESKRSLCKNIKTKLAKKMDKKGILEKNRINDPDMKLIWQEFYEVIKNDTTSEKDNIEEEDDETIPEEPTMIEKIIKRDKTIRRLMDVK